MVKFINIWNRGGTIYIKTKKGLEKIEDYPWYFCISLAAAKENRDVLQEYLRRKVVSKYEIDGDYVKVFCPYEYRDNAVTYMKSLKIQTFEADLEPFKRYLVDEEIELETDMSVLYFDIETSDLKKGINPGDEKILSIAGIGSDGEEYYLTYDDDTTPIGEKKLLQQFNRVVNKYDIIAGWHSEGFDLVAITRRCEIHSVPFSCKVITRTAKDLGGLDSVRRLGNVRAKPYEFNHVDLLQKLKEMHYRDTELIKKVRSFSLSSVSKVFLGKDKVDLKGQSIYHLWKNSPDLLREYNLQDVRLLVELDKKLNITQQKIIEHQVCCARINDYTSHGKIDTFALRGARKMGRRLPSKPDDDEREVIDDGNISSSAVLDPGNKAIKQKGDYQGGYVFEPVTGLHKDVYIFDFQSLYPSIIKTFNVSIDSLVPPENDTLPVITLPTGVKFKRDVIGIIPAIIQDVLDQRNHIRHVVMKKLEKNSPEYMNWHYRQYAFKVLANSMYGIMGASFSRYFKRELAEGITLTGQHVIKHMWDWLSAKRFVPIYGDTDSLFLTHPDKVDTEALAKEIKEHLDKYLVEKFNVKENQIIMDFKGMYPRFIAADKKKYVGITEDGEIEITGLEAKKRDTLPMTEKWQRELLDMLLKGDFDEKFYKNWVLTKRDFVYNKNLELNDIIFQKRLSKEVEEYGDRTTAEGVSKKVPVPAHVKVAAWLKEQGDSGEKINLYSQGAYIPYYIVSSKKGIVAHHPRLFDGTYDVEYYWGSAIYPSLQRILQVVFKQTDWSKPESFNQQRLF